MPPPLCEPVLGGRLRFSASSGLNCDCLTCVSGCMALDGPRVAIERNAGGLKTWCLNAGVPAALDRADQAKERKTLEASRRQTRRDFDRGVHGPTVPGGGRNDV